MGRTVRHTIYEDPITRKFALIRVPRTFLDGDRLPIPPMVRWLDTHDDVVAALPDLFDVDEDEPGTGF
jgi:hypothetical protein